MLSDLILAFGDAAFSLTCSSMYISIYVVVYSFNCLSSFYSYLELQDDFIFRSLYFEQSYASSRTHTNEQSVLRVKS